MSGTAIIGTHGIGKTNTIHLLKFYKGQLGQKVEIIEETAREVKLLGLPINEETTMDAQEAIINTLKNRVMAARHRIQIGEINDFASDRHFLDNVNYAVLKFGWNRTKKLYDLAMKYTEEIEYDHIIRMPLWNRDKIITPDGVRSEKKEFQIAVDQSLNNLLRKAGIQYDTIPEDIFKINNRYEQAVALMKFFDKIYSTK